MSHHGNGPFINEEYAVGFDNLHDLGLPEGAPDFQKRQELLREMMDATNFIGAEGLHPNGKIDQTDEGSIRFALGERNGNVVIDFGTPVHWMGMTPQEAADFASALLRKAREVGRKQGQTVAMTIA